MLSRLLIPAFITTFIMLGLTACGGSDLKDDYHPISQGPEDSGKAVSDNPSDGTDTSDDSDDGTDTAKVINISILKEDGKWSTYSAATPATAPNIIYVSGGVSYEPAAEDDQLTSTLPSPININDSTFTFGYEADDGFIASGASLQFVFQDKKDYSGYYDCTLAADKIKTSGTVTCELPDTGYNITADKGIQFGVQAKGKPAGTFTITSLKITLPNETADGGNTEPLGDYVLKASSDNIGTWQNDNYQSLAAAAELSYSADEDALTIAPHWDATDGNGERTAFYLFEAGTLQSLLGATLKYTLHIPDYYITDHPGMTLQSYVQQNAGSYAGAYIDKLTLDKLTDEGKGDYSFEWVIPDSISGVDDPATLVRMGLKMQRGTMDTGGEAGENILLRSIIINYAK